MAAFPRTILPSASTIPEFPGPMMSQGGTGRAQLRGANALGRRWVETYNGLKTSDVNVRAFIATVQNLWSRGVLFDIEHYLLNTKNGGMTGSPTVNGASQSGSTLAINNAAGSNPVLKAGDLFTLPGMNVVFDVTADAPNLSGGTCTLSINPPIPVGQSPANGAALTYAAPVRFKSVYLCDRPDWPMVSPNVVISGFRLTFQEQP